MVMVMAMVMVLASIRAFRIPTQEQSPSQPSIIEILSRRQQQHHQLRLPHAFCLHPYKIPLSCNLKPIFLHPNKRKQINDQVLTLERRKVSRSKMDTNESSTQLVSSREFTSAMTLTQMGVPCLPPRYVLPPSQRPTNLSLEPPLPPCSLPVIDLTSKVVLNHVQSACHDIGFFQVINHGIPPPVMKDAVHVATSFFNLSIEEKMQMLSDDVRQPVRYGTSMNHGKDKVLYWRDFLKHYSHPISKWIHLWPSNPPDYKEKMGNYAKAAEQLHRQLMTIILETLGLKPPYLQDEMENGSQVMAVNCYPACPEPDLALGMPPHSDYGSLTIILQNNPGLQLLNRDRNWLSVPFIEGALIVQLGDQMEVLSNGRYKSVVHRATVKSNKHRISIASLHSLSMEKKVRPAAELVDEKHPDSYEAFSFNDFLDYFSSKDSIANARFIDTSTRN